MEKSKIKYSLKNIPIPTKKSYQLNLIEKIESLVKCMRWRSWYYLNQQECDNDINQGSVHHYVSTLIYSKKI